MPHSTEAEQAVLGSMLIDARCVPNVIGMLKPDDFYVRANQEIYETIYSMFSFSMVVDPVTVLEQMKIKGTFEEGVSSQYILDLMNITPTAVNVMEYASIVRDKALLRRIAEVGSGVAALAMEEGSAMEVLEVAEKRIYALRQGRSNGGLEEISVVMAEVYENLLKASRSKDKLPGIPTGFIDLDNSIMGLNKSDLILIASRPGMGKTSLALNIALNVAKNSGKTVAVFSLEMSKEQLCMRLLSGEAAIDSQKLQTGRLSDGDWERIGKMAGQISKSDLKIDDNSTLSVADMNAQCRRLQNLGLVVIDYLQLMQSSGGNTGYTNENRQQVVSDISRMLKIMAKELNVPVICLSQLSRANESRTNKRPMLSDLRESGAIEQDADIVLGLYRDDYYNKETEEQNVAECIILKNRRGQTGTIKLGWMPQFTRFTSLETRHDEGDEY
ncbi:MAG: replicative DNA helicase [Oscillospiraceae bacterium]|nr:replicative DNA helicase [Oscillospiraceae bacterium]